LAGLGPDWVQARRAAAFERFASAQLPTDAEEVWRYSRIGQLDLDAYTPLTTPTTLADTTSQLSDDQQMPPELEEVLAACGKRAGLIWLRNGRVARVELDPSLAERGVAVGQLDGTRDGDRILGSVAQPVDVFVDLSEAFTAHPLVVDVPRRVVVEDPIVVLQWVDSPDAAVASRVVVRTGEAAEVTVVDHAASPHSLSALVLPVVELDAGDGSHLSYLNVQALGSRVWQIGYQASRAGRDATLNSTAVAMGGHYARLRSDSRLVGEGGNSKLLALYFGDGEQMHDFRTMQDHEAPKTISDLLFKGAVEDSAHSVYSGLIRVRKGAAGTNAFQTNRNLVLTEGAHADSVPNLEIEENDVRCSHASAVGPIDEDHRYYLEARGVPPAVADRLVVLGFFDEVLERVPVAGLRRPLRRAVAAKLEAVEVATS
jgi:Fe-S cluster assembly protein SufD